MSARVSREDFINAAQNAYVKHVASNPQDIANHDSFVLGFFAGAEFSALLANKMVTDELTNAHLKIIMKAQQ